MIDHRDLVNILHRMGIGKGFWTLHAGGALVHHLGHRLLDELDFYANADTSLGALRDDAVYLLAPLVPADKLDEVRGHFDGTTAGTVKIAFEKVMFSFILTPNCRAITYRVSYNGALFVASFADTIGAKLMGLHDREKISDYIDVASIIKSGLSVGDLVRAVNAMAPYKIDLPLIFQKMAAVPRQVGAMLSPEQIGYLKEVGSKGLQEIGNDAPI